MAALHPHGWRLMSDYARNRSLKKTGSSYVFQGHGGGVVPLIVQVPANPLGAHVGPTQCTSVLIARYEHAFRVTPSRRKTGYRHRRGSVQCISYKEVARPTSVVRGGTHRASVNEVGMSTRPTRRTTKLSSRTSVHQSSQLCSTLLDLEKRCCMHANILS